MYLQTSVVVEYCGRGSTVLELIEIRLKLASVQDFAKEEATRQVLQEQPNWTKWYTKDCEQRINRLQVAPFQDGRKGN